MRMDITGLLERVALERVGRLGYLVVTLNIREADDLYLSGGDFPNLIQFMLIVCSEYECSHYYIV